MGDAGYLGVAAQPAIASRGRAARSRSQQASQVRRPTVTRQRVPVSALVALHQPAEPAEGGGEVGIRGVGEGSAAASIGLGLDRADLKPGAFLRREPLSQRAPQGRIEEHEEACLGDREAGEVPGDVDPEMRQGREQRAGQGLLQGPDRRGGAGRRGWPPGLADRSWRGLRVPIRRRAAPWPQLRIRDPPEGGARARETCRPEAPQGRPPGREEMPAGKGTRREMGESGQWRPRREPAAGSGRRRRLPCRLVALCTRAMSATSAFVRPVAVEGRLSGAW